MSSNVKISVIIPTFHPNHLLQECLLSFSRQTLSSSLWEIILVLNCDDESWRVSLSDILQSFPQLPVRLLDVPPLGVSYARNCGLDAALGAYIAFVDDDDYVSPSYLEELLSKASPDTIAISNTIAFDEQNSNIPYAIGNEFQRCAPNGKQVYLRPKKFFSGPCMKLFPREIIGTDRFDLRFRNGEDSIMMFQISNKMSWVDFTSEQAIYYRRLRPNSASFYTPFTYRFCNSLKLMITYTRLFFTRPGYSFRFYFSRILGSLHTILVG